MSEGHTPGPWRTGDVYYTVFGPPNGNVSPQTICHMSATNTADKRANARLIATAPELYEVLKRIARFLEPRPAMADLRNGSDASALYREAKGILSDVEGKQVTK